MKYLKLFELFDTQKELPYIFKKISNVQYVYYFNIDEKKFGVYFDLSNNVWERNYFRIKNQQRDIDSYHYFNINYGMATKIISCVTYITNIFIRDFNPNIVEITHIPMDKEKNIGKLNKRARINFNYLKNLPIIKSGKYKLSYYKKINASYLFDYNLSFCLITKEGIPNTYEVEKYINSNKYEIVYL